LRIYEERLMMPEQKRVVIAEDETLLREVLRSLLSTQEYVVVGTAEDGVEALRLVQERTPDLIVLDLSMPRQTGMDVIKGVKSCSPETKILVLTVHDSEEYALEALRSGANGYCLKESRREELMTAIRTVLSGKRYISPELSEKVMEGYVEEWKTLKTKSSWESLTPREKEVLGFIGRGAKNREIAGAMSISIKTVERHRSNIMRKLDMHTGSALAAYAIERKLI